MLVDQARSTGYGSPMRSVKVQYAKTHLSALLSAVEAGDEVLISRGDHAVARLVPVTPPPERTLGFVDYAVPDTFENALPSSELDAWDGGQ